MASEEELNKFDEAGYIILEDFLTTEEVEELKQECHGLVEKMDPAEHHSVFSTVNQTKFRNDYFINSGDKIGYFFEEAAVDENGELKAEKHSSLNKIGHALHVLSPSFKKVTLNNKIKDLCKSMGMQKPIIPQSMYIFKQPRIGGAVIPHQDGSFLHTSPSMKLVGVWIALEDATEENGCLWFMPGSHKNGIYGGFRLVRNPDPNDSRCCINIGTKPTFDDSKFVPVPVKKGTAIVIDGLVVHKSEQNCSDKSRHIYTFHLYDEQAGTWDKENWLQPTEKNTFVPLYEYVQ